MIKIIHTVKDGEKIVELDTTSKFDFFIKSMTTPNFDIKNIISFYLDVNDIIELYKFTNNGDEIIAEKLKEDFFKFLHINFINDEHRTEKRKNYKKSIFDKVEIDKLKEKIDISDLIHQNLDSEPKMDHRFIVEFPAELNIDSKFVESISKPTLSMNSYSPITINFIDVISPSISHELYKFHEKFKSQPRETDKGIFSFNIISLDPTGVPVENWKIEVEGINAIHYGSLDLKNDKYSTIQMVVQPKTCILIDIK